MIFIKSISIFSFFPFSVVNNYRKAAYAEPFKSSMAATIPTVEKTRIL